METAIFFIVFLGVVIISLALKLYRVCRKIEDIDEKNAEIGSLQSRLSKKNQEVASFKSQKEALFKSLEKTSRIVESQKERIVELEDTVEKEYGVKVRNEVTEINTNFTKVEWVMILAGVNILLKQSNSVEDSKIYIALIEKMQSFIEQMKEETEEDEQ